MNCEIEERRHLQGPVIRGTIGPDSAQVGETGSHLICAVWCFGFFPCCGSDTGMSNCPPFLAPHTLALQPYHKVCDVTCSTDIKSKADRGAPCRSDPPDVSVRASEPPPWLDCAEETAMMEGLLKNCRIKNRLLRECLAELLGVYVLIVSIDTWRMLKTFTFHIKPSNAAKNPVLK